MTALPTTYKFLDDEPGPIMLTEGLKLFGTHEFMGSGNNPVLLGWADWLGDELGSAYAKWASAFYSADEIPWCGLYVAYVAQMANKQDRPERRPPDKYLSAAEWAKWGLGTNIAMLGDVLVFVRPGGGHVGMYVGEDSLNYHVLGGNQSDQVCIARIAKNRCTAIRRPAYLAQPANVRRIQITQLAGPVSTNEA